MSHVVLEQIGKRRCFPVPELGDKVFVRGMSRGELKRIDKLKEEHKTDFMLGCILVDAEGRPAIAKEAEETDEAFCKRVESATEEMDTPTLNIISETFMKIGKIPPAETIIKN